MEDGPQHKNIAFIIQARMQSTRLPGKILLPVPLWGDKPMLLWIIEALRASENRAEIFVATSKNQENDVLEKFCKAYDISCFRGDEDDVLSRFIAILKSGQYDMVSRLTADNPIVDTGLLDKTIRYHLMEDNDYTYTEGLPLGMNFEVIKAQILVELERQPLTKADREHVTLFLKNNKRYKKSAFEPGLPRLLADIRLTVDYASDILVVSTVLAYAERNEGLRGIDLVSKVNEDHPYLFKANTTNFQKKPFSSLEGELIYASKVLTELDLNRSAAILRGYEAKNTF